MSRRRVLLTSAVAASTACFVLLVPLPHRVSCTFEVRPRHGQPVFVTVPGQIEGVFVATGQRVAAGQPLARLTNVDLQLAAARLDTDAGVQRGRLGSLHYERFADPQAHLLIRQVEEMLSATLEERERKQAEAAQLLVTAPADGYVLPPPRRYPIPHPLTLAEWGGTPLDARNHGALLEAGVLLCEIGDPESLEAVLVVDQADIELVSEDQMVRMTTAALPGQFLQGEVEEVSRQELAHLATGLTTHGGGDVPTHTDRAGGESPASPVYSVRVPLPDTGTLPIGSRGQASIHTGWQTLGGRLWRYLCHTFRFFG